MPSDDHFSLKVADHPFQLVAFIGRIRALIALCDEIGERLRERA
jgi:hypothetical protein